MAHIHRAGDALVRLVELVAIDGIIVEIGKVGKQIQLVLHQIGIDFCLAHVATSLPGSRQADAMRLAAIGLVDCIETVEHAGINRTFWNLVGCIPLRRVCHRGDVEAIGFASFAIAYNAVELAVVVGIYKWPVVVKTLKRIEQLSIAQFRRCGQ